MFADPYLYLYACGSFSNGVFISLRGPVIPELARRVGKPSAALGAYLGIGGLSGGVFALPTGWLLDKTDAHAVFAFGTLLRAVSVGATPWCTSLWQVNVLSLVQGATLPLIGITIRVCLVRAVGQRKCAQALNFTMGAFGLASIVTPLVYAESQRTFGDAEGFEFVFHLVAFAYVFLALVAFLGFKTPPPDVEASVTESVFGGDDGAPERGARHEDAEGEEELLLDLFSPPPNDDEYRSREDEVFFPPFSSPVRRRLFEESQEPSPRDRDAHPRGGGEENVDAGLRIRVLFRERLTRTSSPRETRKPTVRAGSTPERPPFALLFPMTVYACLSVASEVPFGSWIYTLAVEREGFGNASAANLTSAFWASFTATRFLFSFLGSAPERAVAFSHALTFVSTGFLALRWGGVLGFLGGNTGGASSESNSSSRCVLWVITLLTGCGTAGMFPNGVALGRRLFPLTGFAQAAFELGASLGSGLGPYVGSKIYEITGDSAAIPATCTVSGAGAVFAVCFAFSSFREGLVSRRSVRVEETAGTEASLETLSVVAPAGVDDETDDATVPFPGDAVYIADPVVL
jgi:FHS family Na+ dependent glucose MFS transporter 1